MKLFLHYVALAAFAFDITETAAQPVITSTPSQTVDDTDAEPVIAYITDSTGCDNQLDEARIFVAVSDFLLAYAASSEMPDVQSLETEETCTAAYKECNISQGGGCCSGYTCKLTSNGLERCVFPTYEATPTELGGECTRGQPCEPGLQCQDDTETVGSTDPLKLCLAPPSPARHLRVQPMLQSAAEDNSVKLAVSRAPTQSQEQRELEVYHNWCMKPRNCGHCTRENFFSKTDQGKENLDYNCSMMCPTSRCNSRRNRRLSANTDMDGIIQALEAYINMLDFGDDCDASSLRFAWKVTVVADEVVA